MSIKKTIIGNHVQLFDEGDRVSIETDKGGLMIGETAEVLNFDSKDGSYQIILDDGNDIHWVYPGCLSEIPRWPTA